MGKQLTTAPTKLIWLLNLAKAVPPSKNPEDLKMSVFRRALKTALVKFTDGQEKILEVFRADFKEYDTKKNELLKLQSEEKDEKKKKTHQPAIDEVEKAIADMQEEANGKIKEYNEAHKEELTATFDNEAFEYAKNVLSKAATDLFGQYLKDKDGNVKQEQYNADIADELWELLDKAK
jgi:hypothetical protein